MYSPQQADARIEGRLRVLRVLWGAFLVTVGLFTLVACLARPGGEAEVARARGGAAPAVIPPALFVFFALGIAAVVASFVLKQTFARKAAVGQQPGLFQQGLILALVFCEMAALFGMMGLFVTGSQYAYALLALGALGIALHFPRREQLLAASFRPVG